MDPTTGTFLSVDPVVGDALDPQQHNGYAYARNNPISYNDPTGMCVWACGDWYGQLPAGMSPYQATNGGAAIPVFGAAGTPSIGAASGGPVAGGGTPPPTPLDVARSMGTFFKGVIDFAIGEDFGAAWRGVFGDWVQDHIGLSALLGIGAGVLAEDMASESAPEDGPLDDSSSRQAAPSPHSSSSSSPAVTGTPGAAASGLSGFTPTPTQAPTHFPVPPPPVRAIVTIEDLPF